MKRDKNRLWSALVKSQSGDYQKWCSEKNRDQNRMKLAAFDCLTAVLKERKFKIKDNFKKEPIEPPLPQNKPIPIASTAPSAPPPPLVPPAPPAPSIPASAREFTPEQKHIFNFVKNGTGHGIIDAVAGAGKTTTIMECSEYVEDKSEILFCAFNKSIQTEIANKFAKRGMNEVTVKTIHALGYQILRDNNKSDKKLVPQEQKYRTLLQKDPDLNDKIQKYEEKLLQLNSYSINETESNKRFAVKDFLYKFRDRLLDMNQKIRATLTPDNLEQFKNLVEHFNFFSDADIKAKSFDKELKIYFECSKILLDAGNTLAKESIP